MSITLNTVPINHSAMRNPMLVEMTGSDYYSNTGTQQVVVVTDNVPRTSGQTATFTIGESVIIVTFFNSPNSTNAEVRAHTNSTTFDQMIGNFNEIPILGELFTITGTYGVFPQVITFTQKKADTTKQLTITGWTGAGIANTAAVNPVTQPNYKGIVRVYKQSDFTANREFNLIAEFGAIPGETGNDMSIKELQKAFSGVLVPDPPQDVDTAGIVACTKMHCWYWLAANERYGSEAKDYTPKMHGYKNNYPSVVRGGMPWETWDADVVNDDYFSSASLFFFTNLKTKTVGTGQPEWLYFYNPEVRTVKVHVTATFTDGTTDTFYSATTVDLAIGMWRVPVGYTQMDIVGSVTIPSGQKVVSYTVDLHNASNTALTEEITYKVDHGSAAEEYLVWENLWGGYDTLRLRGAMGYGVEGETVDAVAVQQPDYETNEGPISTYNTRNRDVISVGTGMLTRTEMEWLKELADSDDMYLVSGNKLQRYVLDKDVFGAMYSRALPIDGLTFTLRAGNWR